jgi:ABC-type nitrate/sulfonate/bicarbonate transport system permease component
MNSTVAGEMMTGEIMTAPRTGLPSPSAAPASPSDRPVGRRAIGTGRRRGGRASARILLGQVAVLAGAVGVWWLVSLRAGTGTVSTPAQTFRALITLSGEGAFWKALLETSVTWAIGITVCAVVGIPLGVFVGSNRFATQSTRFIFDFMRTIPPVALLPLGLLLYGPTRTMVLLLVIAGGIWPLLIQSVYAAQQQEALLGDVARAFRLTRRSRFLDIFWPSSLPFVMSGLRVTGTICLLLTVLGELLGGAPGIGTEIQLAANATNIPTLYALVIAAACLGVAVNALLGVLRKRVLRWHPSVRGGTR